jgi:hypothetical protein
LPHMKRMRSGIVLALLTGGAIASCQSGAPEAPRAPSAPPSAPVAPVVAPLAAAAPSDAAMVEKKSKLPPAPTDGLSLSDRIEKRKAAEAKLAAQLAGDERKRLLAYDKGKLALHYQVFTFITRTRAELDHAKDRAAVEKMSAKENPAIVATGKKLRLIDPKGGNSNVTTDYDVMLNALANDYPAALSASFEGDPKPLAEQRSELDKRTKKITEWLAAIKAGK